MNQAIQTVTVISCSHAEWIKSSHNMGERLMTACHATSYRVATPRHKEDFSALWGELEGAVILHTHGSEAGLYDQTEGETPLICSVEDLDSLPCNSKILLAVSTACETASGDPLHNVAATVSKKINENGLTLANRYIVWGASEDFEAEGGIHGWVAYSGGRLIRTPKELPVSINFDFISRLWQQECSRRLSLYAHATVSVIGCRNSNWAESSRIMGEELAKAIGRPAEFTVKEPADPKEFATAWNSLGFAAVIHTFGSYKSLYEDSPEGLREIISYADIEKLPALCQTQLVVITAGFTAGGDENRNVASAISRKISPSGIVIANQAGLYGYASEFTSCDSLRGWTIYQGGKELRSREKLPLTLTMEKAYRLYWESFTK